MRIHLQLLSCLLAAVLAWPVSAAIPASVQNEIVEFYNKSLDHYFITADSQEMQDLDSGLHAGWARTGYRFPGIKIGSGQPATTAVCRFYGRPEAKIDSHFYSSKASECDDVKVKFPNAWQFEADEVFRAFAVDGNTGKCSTDTVPVYRLWNQRSDVNHRYTDQLAVYQQMIAKGYKAEGDGSPALPVAFCMPAGGSSIPPPPAGAPSCSLSTTTSTPALGTFLLLTATCSGSPTSYSWTGCASTSGSCQASNPIAGAATYSLTATNSSGTGAPVTLAVTWGTAIAPPPPPSGSVPVCTVSASSGTPTVGSSLTLSANCSQTPTRYDWYECSYLIQTLCNAIPACPTNAASCTFSGSTSGLAHYAVAGTNSAGPGAKSGLDVEWGGGSGGGGGALPTVPVCSALTSDPAPTVGTSIVLNASCTGSPTSYSWTGVACSNASCATSSPAIGPQTYSVTAANALGASGPGSVTVNWQAPAAPSCTLSASSTSPTVGQTVAISAACNGSPTSYKWTGCASSGPGCSDSSTTTGPKTYTMTAANVSGPGAVASVTVTWAAAPTAVPVCTVTASTTSPFAGQGVTLTAACTNSPASYAWTNCASTASTCDANSNTAGIQSYTVVARNVVGPSAATGVNVTWQAAVGGTDFCGSYQNVQRMGKGWNDNVPIYTQSNGGFAANGVYVVSFVASSQSGFSTPGSTSVAEYNGPPTFRQMTLSSSACDFRDPDPTGVKGPYAVGNGNTATIAWNVGSAPVGLVPGRTYYFNFRNWIADLGVQSCAIGACNAIIQVNWPK